MNHTKSEQFVSPKNCRTNPRKQGLNRNKNGSVRKINGMIYVDFIYLGERVREPSGFCWNEENAKNVRKQMDRITAAIQAGTFRYAEIFPHSKRIQHFIEKEQVALGLKISPAQINVGSYMDEWYERLKDSGRITGRTLFGYKDMIRAYLSPFFGKHSFADLNIILLDHFYSWARQQKYRGKTISNASLNKCVTILKIITKSAAIKSGWGSEFKPFQGYKKLSVDDPYRKVFPFSVEEQARLNEAFPDHWKPYFKFAFSSGLRQGEQIAIKPEDIDWDKRILHIQRALTLGEDGKPMEGKTKNKYSRRSIPLLPIMYDALLEQKAIVDQLDSAEYFFCTVTGKRIHPSNFRKQVWIPAL